MKWTLFFSGFLCCAAVEAADSNSLVDPAYKKAVVAKWAFVEDKCSASKNMALKMDCYTARQAEFDSKGTVRGTKAYMDKHYASLSLSDAERKREQLKKLLALAEKEQRFSMNTKPEKGELNADLLAGEIRYLNSIIKAQKSAKPTLADEAEALGAPKLADRIRKLVKPAE